MCVLEVGSPPPDTASLSHGPDLKEENLCTASGQRWRGSPDKVMLSFLVVSALGQGGSPLSGWYMQDHVGLSESQGWVGSACASHCQACVWQCVFVLV